MGNHDAVGYCLIQTSFPLIQTTKSGFMYKKKYLKNKEKCQVMNNTNIKKICNRKTERT